MSGLLSCYYCFQDQISLSQVGYGESDCEWIFLYSEEDFGAIQDRQIPIK